MRKTPKTTVRLILFLLVAAAVALAIGTTSAKAGSNLLGGCSGEQLSQPFLPWLEATASFVATCGDAPAMLPARLMGGWCDLLVRLGKRYPKPKYTITRRKRVGAGTDYDWRNVHVGLF